MRVALLFVVLAGCAGIDQATCHRADWYDIGFRDAIFGIQRQDDLLALQCEPHGVKVDETRYLQGFIEGRYEAERRRASAHD